MCHKTIFIDSHTVEVETYCPVLCKQVVLLLECETPQQGEIVKGKPIVCDSERADCIDHDKCFLTSIQIETKRNK